MRVAVAGAVVFSVGFCVLAGSPGHAQSLPPATLPAQAAPPAPSAPPPLPGFTPYEVSNIVRAAGFDPLLMPLREGATYVVRATDFRGILMRVVVDARTGALRAVNRIVAGPGSYGPAGMMPPPYGVPPSYRSVDLNGADEPPLPRPRPAALAARKSGEEVKADAKPDARPDSPKPDTKSADQEAKPTTAASAEPVVRKRPPPPPPFPE